MIAVDPARIRFQHSRIRPFFSGCGRHLQETLESIRSGEISAEDLPPIQVSFSQVFPFQLPAYELMQIGLDWTRNR